MRGMDLETDTILLIGAILLGIMALVGITNAITDTYESSPDAQAIVAVQTITSAANSLSMVEKGEFNMIFRNPVRITVKKDKDGVSVLKIIYKSFININSTGFDLIDDVLVQDYGPLTNGEYEMAFLCDVKETDISDVNALYISKIPEENFVRIQDLRAKVTGGNVI